MWVRGHSRSFKVVPFVSLGTVSYSPSIVTMALSLAISEIFSVKEWPDLENMVLGRSRSFKMARFDRSCMTFWQAWCCLQIKLCDPCLSALRTRYLSSRALYKSTYLYLNLR